MNSNILHRENFVQHEIIDREQGVSAGIFEHPRNWLAESKVCWNYRNTALPVVYRARIANPRNLEMFEFLPMEGFSWAANLPLMSGVNALVHLIVPKYRQGRQSLRVMKAESLPADVKSGSSKSFEETKVHKIQIKIEYEESGQALEEEFHGLYSIYRAPINNGWGTTYFTGWNLTNLCCFRAARGELENIREVFLKIQSSLAPNLQWLELSNQISQMLLLNSQYTAESVTKSDWEKTQTKAESTLLFNAETQINIEGQKEVTDSIYNTMILEP